MNKRLDEILNYMDKTRADLLETAGQVNSTFASMRPQPGAWSVADILSHLAMVEEGVARMVAKSVDWARTNDIGPETSEESLLRSLDSFDIESGAGKIEAPASVFPTERPADESIAALRQSRASLREALRAGADLDLSRVFRPHRIFGEINLYQWALFVAQHEERHRRQIERTISHVTERAAECAPMV
jgi:hypothetical protein